MRQPPTLSSSHNPRFKAALALREARERRATGRILVDGGREIGRITGYSNDDAFWGLLTALAAKLPGASRADRI